MGDDCDCSYRAGELAPIRSENRGKEEGTSRAEPLGIHHGAHLINPPGQYDPSTRAFSICKQDFRPPPPLRNPPSEGPKFVFVCFHDTVTVTVPVQLRAELAWSELHCGHHLIWLARQYDRLLTLWACPTRAVCSLCSSLPCLGSYCSQSLGPRNRRPPSLPPSTKTVQLPGWRPFRPCPASGWPSRSGVPSPLGTR